jgi:hypothetical protein
VTDLRKPSQMSLPKIYCLSLSEIGVHVSVLVVLDAKTVNLYGFCTVRAQIYLATELIVCLFVFPLMYSIFYRTWTFVRVTS